MPQQALLKALEEDARTQSGNIINSAKEAADAILSRAAEETESLRARRIEELGATLARKRASMVNSARTRANAEKLKVRHELIEQVFSAALESAGSIDGDEYARVVNALVEELAAAFDNASCSGARILVDPGYTGRVNIPGLEVEADGSVGLGAVIISSDGRLVCENTVASRLEKAKNELMPVVDKLLFG